MGHGSCEAHVMARKKRKENASNRRTTWKSEMKKGKQEAQQKVFNYASELQLGAHQKGVIPGASRGVKVGYNIAVFGAAGQHFISISKRKRNANCNWIYFVFVFTLLYFKFSGERRVVKILQVSRLGWINNK